MVRAAEGLVEDFAQMSASIHESKHLPKLVWFPHGTLLHDVGTSIDTLPFEVAKSSEALCDRLQLELVDLLTLNPSITVIDYSQILDQGPAASRDVVDKLCSSRKLDNDEGGHGV